MITIQKSKTAKSSTCDFTKVSKEELLVSSHQHVQDVAKGMQFFANQLLEAANNHDHDKFSDIDGFYADIKTNFKQTEWWDKHRKVNRHHLLCEDGVPEDVNLIDVLDMIVDCVMAGMARSGDVYPLEISQAVLMEAFKNTVDLLQAQVVVEG